MLTCALYGGNGPQCVTGCATSSITDLRRLMAQAKRTKGTENRDNGTDNRKTGVCSIVADLQRLMGQADQDLALRCRRQYGRIDRNNRSLSKPVAPAVARRRSQWRMARRTCASHIVLRTAYVQAAV